MEKRNLSVHCYLNKNRVETCAPFCGAHSNSMFNIFLVFLERETGFEPATSTLARLHSTAELFPRRNLLLNYGSWFVKPKKLLVVTPQLSAAFPWMTVEFTAFFYFTPRITEGLLLVLESENPNALLQPTPWRQTGVFYGARYLINRASKAWQAVHSM